VVVFGLTWLLEADAMRRQEDPLGERAPEPLDEPPIEQEPSRLLR
jgi:hypothetical protein